MPYQPSLWEYGVLLDAFRASGNIGRLLNVHDAMASQIFGMQKVYSCAADYADPKKISVDGVEVPRCVCARYQTPDKTRGMLMVLSFNYLSPEELDQRIEAEKEMAVSASIAQTLAANHGKIFPKNFREQIRAQIEHAYEERKRTYRPDLMQATVYTGRWAPGLTDDNMMIGGMGSDAADNVTNGVGCSKALDGVKDGILYVPERPFDFMLNTLFEDEQRRAGK